MEEKKAEKESQKPYKELDKKTVLQWIGNNIQPPKRGTTYTYDEISHIKSLASKFTSFIQREPTEIMKHWNSLISQWQKDMIAKLGDKLFIKIFSVKEQINKDWINSNDMKGWHPLNSISLESRFSINEGVLCKYGDCFFEQKENWTYKNVTDSFKNSILNIDKRIVEYLNELSDKEMYDGSINIKEWIDKYSERLDSHFKAHILYSVYKLDADYKNVGEVIKAYVKDYKEHKEEKPEPAPEPVRQPEPDKPETKKPEVTSRIKLSDLYNIKPENDKGFTKIGYRKKEFLKTPVLLGRERVIVLANGEIHRSVFAIVEMDQILASHNEKTYNDTENYPLNEKGGNINDRNYKDDKNSQYKVRDIAEHFDPEIQISTSATAAGLPVITIDGIVVSGNNRIMSMKLMESDYNENYKNYVKTLSDEIGYGGYGDFGYDSLDWLKISIRDNHLGTDDGTMQNIIFKKPILVRIDLDFPEYNTMEMAKYNKDTKKVKRPIDKAIELGKILEANESCFNNISEIIGKFDNISEFYASKSDIHNIKNFLVSCQILTTNELPAYIESGMFTNAGKEFLENLMAGMILGKEQLIASEMEGVKRLKQIIVQSLPVLIKNSKLEGFSLKQYINDAIIVQQKLVSNKLSIIDFIAQFQMFQEHTDTYPDKSFYINLLLNTGKLKFKKAIETYNNSAEQNIGGSMFGEVVTIDEMFEKLIIPALDQKDVEAIKKYFGKAEKPAAEEKPEIIEEKTEKKEEKIIQPKIELTKPEIEKLLRGLEIQFKHKPTDILSVRIKGLKLLLKYKK